MKKVMDGNEAVAYISYSFTEASVIYPITPSSTMAEKVEELANKYQMCNAFGKVVKTIEMQSEAGVAGAMHGLLKTGTLTTSYTCSQGLLLMEPTLYKMVGEMLPAVIHVSARAVSRSALSIFGDHSDVMAVRQLGSIILASSTVQEAALFAAVAHETAIQAKLPVVHFFDGFNTSHEQQKIELPSYKQIEEVLDSEAYTNFKMNSIRNDKPRAYGASMTPDIFFQQLEANNKTYLSVPEIIQRNLAKFNPLFETNCHLVDFYGKESAETIIVAMGSVSLTIEQVVDELNLSGGHYGSINVHLYRPFPVEEFVKAIPKTVKNIVVLDRTKEAGSVAEPLLADVISTCYDLESHPRIIGGRYGLGSKDVTPDQIRAALIEAEKVNPKKRFTLGIVDDVTHLSLEPVGSMDLTESLAYQMKSWGFGSDGAVSGHKEIAKIIGELTKFNVQGQYWFDPRKSGNLTVSHVRFSPMRIRSAYKVQSCDFVSSYAERYVKKYPLLDDLKENGFFLLNSDSSDKELENVLPNRLKKQIAEKRINFYTVPASKIARLVQLGPKINMIMLICFLKLCDRIPFEESSALLRDYVSSKYGTINGTSTKRNLAAMERALSEMRQVNVPEKWLHLKENQSEETTNEESNYFLDFQKPINEGNGNQITVRTFVENSLLDGSLPLGTAKLEKRDISDYIPRWDSANCFQCNLCATVCPHAAIRPFLLDDHSGQTDISFETVKARGKKNQRYRIQVSPLDCTGCSLCYDICPSRKKAINMVETKKDREIESHNWEYLVAQRPPKRDSTVNKINFKELQFEQPMLEFSGACAGCGETAYVKMLTQLFGPSMIIANSTGCSSIWGCSAPAVPYTANENGYGPVWGTSLLENNAEYGYGMQVGTTILQENLAHDIEQFANHEKYSQAFRVACNKWLHSYENNQHDENVAQSLIYATLNELDSCPEVLPLFQLRHLLTKRSQWLIGGDGWAYDIGFGGLDHIISKRDDVNILILDNEGYSNTGGQTSKASPVATRSKFSHRGNNSRKKDLPLMLMSYEHVYIAQVCLGANPEQTLKAIIEAEQYPGPSVIIAYSPCVIHGISQNSSIIEEKKAVECGYWSLFRYQPEMKGTSRRMSIDSAEPKWELYREFLLGEQRFSSLLKSNEEECEQLLSINEEEAKNRYKKYQTLKTELLDNETCKKL